MAERAQVTSNGRRSAPCRGDSLRAGCSSASPRSSPSSAAILPCGTVVRQPTQFRLQGGRVHWEPRERMRFVQVTERVLTPGHQFVEVHIAGLGARRRREQTGRRRLRQPLFGSARRGAKGFPAIVAFQFALEMLGRLMRDVERADGRRVGRRKASTPPFRSVPSSLRMVRGTRPVRRLVSSN